MFSEVNFNLNVKSSFGADFDEISGFVIPENEGVPVGQRTDTPDIDVLHSDRRRLQLPPLLKAPVRHETLERPTCFSCFFYK